MPSPARWEINEEDRHNNLLFEVTRTMAADWLLIERLRVPKRGEDKSLRLYEELELGWKQNQACQSLHQGICN